MSINICAQCAYEMDAFDETCPRCARGALATVPKSNSANKLPLKEYQNRARELGQRGELVRAINTLKEAAELYPDDSATRNVLVGLLDQSGRTAEANEQRQELIFQQMRASEAFCVQYAGQALNAGDFETARPLFERSLTYYPNSPMLRDGMARVLAAQGDTASAQQQRSLAMGLQTQRNMQVRAANDRTATNLETAGIVAGTAIGATGAAVGGGITLLSIVTGGLAMLVAAACCVGGFLLCLTCIGAFLGLPLIILGLYIFPIGLVILMGGAAAGTGIGFMGLFTGGLAGGAAALSRKNRRERQ